MARKTDEVFVGLKNACSSIVSAGKHFLNTNLSVLSIVGTCDIFVYRMGHQTMWSTRLVDSNL